MESTGKANIIIDRPMEGNTLFFSALAMFDIVGIADQHGTETRTDQDDAVVDLQEETNDVTPSSNLVVTSASIAGVNYRRLKTGNSQLVDHLAIVRMFRRISHRCRL